MCKTISFLGNSEHILLGKPLDIEQFTNQKDGTYVITLREYLSIITINNAKVKYAVNRIKRC